MALNFRDYSADQVEAARSVLLELVHLLGEYRDDIVVVGGWVDERAARVRDAFERVSYLLRALGAG